MGCDTLTDTSGLLGVINSYRQANGVPQLLLSETLMNAAQWKADDIRSQRRCEYLDSWGRYPDQLAWDFGYPEGYAPSSLLACFAADPRAALVWWDTDPLAKSILLDSGYPVCGVGMADWGLLPGTKTWFVLMGPIDDCPRPPCFAGCTCFYKGRTMEYCDCPEGTYPCPDPCDCHEPPCPDGCTCPPVGPCYCKNWTGPCPEPCACSPTADCPPACTKLPGGQCDCSGAQTGLGMGLVLLGAAAMGISAIVVLSRRREE